MDAVIDFGHELEALREELLGEIARLRMTVEQHHRELMEAMGIEAPGLGRPAPSPAGGKPPRLRTPDAVSRLASRWAAAVIARDDDAVKRIERRMRRAK